jgi:hypothetical protein
LPARSAAEAAARLGVAHGLFSHLHKSIKSMNIRNARAAPKRPGSREAELERA